VPDIIEIESFVRELLNGPKHKREFGRFQRFVASSIDLRFALEVENAALAATQLRFCAWRVWGRVDRLPERLEKRLTMIGVL